jgi:hypothetical protein
MKVPPHRPPSVGRRAPDDAQQVARGTWSALLAVAGAVATLTGLVYFVGALSLWIALRHRGYSADVVIRHQPREQLIAIGLRGALLLTAIAVALALVSLMSMRSKRVSKRVGEASFRRIAVFACLLLVGASVLSWRYVALAMVVSTLIIFNAVRTHLSERWRLWYWVILLAPATLATVAWVAGGRVLVPAVDVTPVSSTPVRDPWIGQPDKEAIAEGAPDPSCGGGSTSYGYVGGRWIPVKELDECSRPDALPTATIRRRLQSECPVPYFGETDGLVYLGEIKDVLQGAGGGCTWDAGAVVELKREEIRLSFRKEKIYLGTSTRRPIVASGLAVWRFIEGVDARLLPRD